MSDMITVVNRGLLQFAVGRQIFCPRCPSRHSLDVSAAVLVTLQGREYLMCATQYDEVKLAVADTAAQHGWPLEVLDGRVLFPQPVRKPRKRPAAAPQTAPERHARIVAALTAYDRRQQALAARNPRRSHNPHALALYFDALSQAEAEIARGDAPVEALSRHYCAPLLAVVLRAAGEVQ